MFMVLIQQLVCFDEKLRLILIFLHISSSSSFVCVCVLILSLFSFLFVCFCFIFVWCLSFFVCKIIIGFYCQYHPDINVLVDWV